MTRTPWPFLLREVFDVDYPDIARMLAGRSRKENRRRRQQVAGGAGARSA
ncbi:MAG: hypothetical protein M3N82_03705 [Pseudomonadota bacterium]|nr:hypothetical protein [Pseudomonadota bacterium]